MNEQLLLEQVRYDSPLSRAELARISGLSKPTVALALANLEHDGLVRVAGHRTGVRGPAAVLYEIRPEAGYVLGLDIGREFVRGALADLSGARLSGCNLARSRFRETGSHPLQGDPDRDREPGRVRPGPRGADDGAQPAGLGATGRAH